VEGKVTLALHRFSRCSLQNFNPGRGSLPDGTKTDRKAWRHAGAGYFGL